MADPAPCTLNLAQLDKGSSTEDRTNTTNSFVTHGCLRPQPHLKRQASNHRPRLGRRWNPRRPFCCVSLGDKTVGFAASEAGHEGCEQPGREGGMLSRACSTLRFLKNCWRRANIGNGIVEGKDTPPESRGLDCRGKEASSSIISKATPA